MDVCVSVKEETVFSSDGTFVETGQKIETVLSSQKIQRMLFVRCRCNVYELYCLEKTTGAFCSLVMKREHSMCAGLQTIASQLQSNDDRTKKQIYLITTCDSTQQIMLFIFFLHNLRS